MSTHNQPPENSPATPGEVTFFTIFKSVFASFFGVQSNANRKRDFESGKFWHFFFAGLHDSSVDAIKSIEGVDICWVEEAQTLSQRSLDVLIPTIRVDGSEIWFSFNPRFATDPVYDRFLGGGPPPGTVLINVNWSDNRFFPEVLDGDRRWMQKRDPEKYMHVWEGGIVTMSEARIFRNWEIKEFETPPGTVIHLAADWGLSVDPSCILGCWFDDDKRELYIDREVLEYTTDIAELPALFARCPGSKQWPIVYDSSRPELGKELKKEGYRMKPARKGPNSIMEGIEFLQSYNIYVHPRCKNTIYELSNYAYKVDKQTEKVILPAVPADKTNHICDCLRYNAEGRWMKQSGDWLKRMTA